MQGIVYLAQNNQSSKQIISTLTSLGGYMIVCVIIGMYLDQRFFHNNGIVVIVSVLVGIFFVILGLIRMVKDFDDS